MGTTRDIFKLSINGKNELLVPSISPLSKSATSLDSSSESWGPKKSPRHSTSSNFPCFVSIALIFENNSRIDPIAGPTVRL